MINIKGSYVGGRLDSEECIDFFARGLIKAPFKIAPLKDLPHIFGLMGEYILLFDIICWELLTLYQKNKAKSWDDTCLKYPSNLTTHDELYDHW